MSVDTVGLVVGLVTGDDVLEALKSYPHAREIEVRTGTFGWSVRFLDGISPRQMSVTQIPEAEADSERDLPFHGDMTQIRMGAHGNAVSIMETTLKGFGGFLNESDQNDDYRFVEADRDVLDTPIAQFRKALGQSLEPAQAAILSGLANDPDKLAAVIEAAQQFLTSNSPRL